MKLAAVLLAVPLIVLTGCGDDEQLGEANVRGACPGQMFVGFPETIDVNVRNTGSEDWPAAFVNWDGLDDFVINGARSENSGPGEDVGHGSFRYGPLKAGARDTYTLAITPKEPGNPDIEFSVWGEDPDEATGIPTGSSVDIYECTEIAVNP